MNPASIDVTQAEEDECPIHPVHSRGCYTTQPVAHSDLYMHIIYVVFHSVVRILHSAFLCSPVRAALRVARDWGDNHRTFVLSQGFLFTYIHGTESHLRASVTMWVAGRGKPFAQHNEEYSVRNVWFDEMRLETSWRIWWREEHDYWVVQLLNEKLLGMLTDFLDSMDWFYIRVYIDKSNLELKTAQCRF